MNILSVAAEASPFSTVGGLARGIQGLNSALSQQHDVRLFTPLYGTTMTYLGQTSINHMVRRDCFLEYDHPPFPVIFYDSAKYFSARSNIYGHSDDYLRFYSFSLACADWLLFQFENKLWFPDIIHSHDWHTGYLSEIIRTFPQYKKISHLPIFFTIHNFKYQGARNLQYQDLNNQDDNSTPLTKATPTQLIKVNPLLRGIIYSHKVNTVSPNYALECLTPEFGYNLSPYTQKYRRKISGILNGLDINEFDPKKFPLSRPKSKVTLQKKFKLPTNKNAFLCAFVGRLCAQKGLELIPPAIDHLIEEGLNLQLIVQGAGDDVYYDLFHDLKQRHPLRISLNYVHDNEIPKLIYASADALLVPSQFEPGGNVVLEALRFGCVPIVRNTGGMTNSVTMFDLQKDGNGFLFNNFNWNSLSSTLYHAYMAHQNSTVWETLVSNCQHYQRTWETVSHEYTKWFKST